MTTEFKRFPKPDSSKAGDKRERSKAKLALWQKVRKAVLLRDGRRCRVCHSRQDVEVHHLRFRSRGGGHLTANCAVLCQECHYAVHAYRLAIHGDADGVLTIERTA